MQRWNYMNCSVRNLLLSNTGAVSIVLLGLFLIPDVRAESVVEELRNKGQQCQSWIDAGDVSRRQGYNCVALCERYGVSVEQHPELLSDGAVRGCNETYSRLRKSLPGMQQPTVPATETHRVRKERESIEERMQRRVSMPDLEGLLVSAGIGGLRVRADSRDDWKDICSETAKVRMPYETSKSLKTMTRVSLVGITYLPEANGRRSGSGCTAERVIILEQSPTQTR